MYDTHVCTSALSFQIFLFYVHSPPVVQHLPDCSEQVRWADPLVQIVHPVDSPLKHDARPRSISADSPDAINLLGRNGRTASRCKNATRQSKAAFFSNPKSRAPNSRSDIDRSRPTTKCEAPRSPPTSTSRPPPRSPPPPTSKQSRKAYASRRETLSLVFSQRKGMVRPSSVRPNARTRSSQSFTLIDSKGGVDREQVCVMFVSCYAVMSCVMCCVVPLCYFEIHKLYSTPPSCNARSLVLQTNITPFGIVLS